MSALPEVNVFATPVKIVTHPTEWHVEQVDSDGDGGIDVAIFVGPNAEVRASEYADRLRLGLGATP
jgi:hypothetical protein